MRRPKGLYVNIASLTELVAAACAIAGVDMLAGAAWALIATAILLTVTAELLMDGHKQTRVIPLPERWPSPRARARKIRGRLVIWRVDVVDGVRDRLTARRSD